MRGSGFGTQPCPATGTGEPVPAQEELGAPSDAPADEAAERLEAGRAVRLKGDVCEGRPFALGEGQQVAAFGVPLVHEALQ